MICLKNFNDFLCISVDEGRGGGFINACIHVCMWEHKAFPTEPIDGY